MTEFLEQPLPSIIFSDADQHDLPIQHFHLVILVEPDQELENFHYFLRGIAANHPEWRVAVIGSMFEDDVIRVANLVQESGFDTTVLTRYCLSNKTFVNLDNLLTYRDWLRQHGSYEEDNWLRFLDEDEDLDFEEDYDSEGETGDN